MEKPSAVEEDALIFDSLRCPAAVLRPDHEGNPDGPKLVFAPQTRERFTVSPCSCQVNLGIRLGSCGQRGRS
jgi:hypothetical protein